MNRHTIGNFPNWSQQGQGPPPEGLATPRSFPNPEPWVPPGPPQPFMGFPGPGPMQASNNAGSVPFNGNQPMQQHFGPPRMGPGPPPMQWNWNMPPRFGPWPYPNSPMFGPHGDQLQRSRPPARSERQQFRDADPIPAPQLDKVQLNPKDSDRSLVDNFLSSIGKLPSKKLPTCKQSFKATIKICEAQQMLSRAKELVQVLDSTTDPSDKARQKNKDELSTILAKMKDPDVVDNLKMKIKQRQKSRERKKYKRKKAYEKMQEEKRQIEERHLKIEEWQNQENEKLDQQLREKEMQKQIDEALMEVRKEQNTSAKAMEMISFLAKLRKIRYNSRKLRSEDVPDENTNSQFDNTVKSVKEKLLAHKTECEEKAASLKLYLEGEQEKAKREIERKKQKIEAEKRKAWENERENILFGKPIDIDAFNALWPVQQLHKQGNSSFSNFIQYRHMWDKYLNQAGTTIPLGWVEPVKPSSVEWKKFTSHLNMDSDEN